MDTWDRLTKCQAAGRAQHWSEQKDLGLEFQYQQGSRSEKQTMMDTDTVAPVKSRPVDPGRGKGTQGKLQLRQNVQKRAVYTRTQREDRSSSNTSKTQKDGR